MLSTLDELNTRCKAEGEGKKKNFFSFVCTFALPFPPNNALGGQAAAEPAGQARLP
jgi:hypothetical protein